jgi:hypothetical protein
MVTATEAQRRAVMHLETIEPMLDDLPEVADQWAHLNEGEQASWSLDWSSEMSKLEHLAQYASQGLLSADQRKHYRQLVQTVKLRLPVIRRLNLYEPIIRLGQE